MIVRIGVEFDLFCLFSDLIVYLQSFLSLIFVRTQIHFPNLLSNDQNEGEMKFCHRLLGWCCSGIMVNDCAGKCQICGTNYCTVFNYERPIFRKVGSVLLHSAMGMPKRVPTSRFRVVQRGESMVYMDFECHSLEVCPIFDPGEKQSVKCLVEGYASWPKANN